MQTPTSRMLSLDVFRGMTIAAMILVNNPGSWSYVYTPLDHAKWHGATPTDWIFPFFLFIVGVSIALAIGRRKETGTDRKALIKKILWRSLIIFAIGLFLAAYPYFDLSTLRIPGVLQRIALVYGATALLFLWLDARQMFWLGVGCLLAYWGMMTLIPVPGGHAPNLEPGTNLGAWIDATLLGGHLWSQSKTWDPEGLLSTLPAIATSISGVLAGVWLCSNRNQFEKVAGLLVAGAVLLTGGLLWNTVFPINKQLWTSSYVLYTSGLALLVFGVLHWWIDIKGYRRGTLPFVGYGTNALIVFAVSGLLARTLNAIHLTDASGNAVNIKTWLWGSVFEPAFASPYNASLAHAIAYVLLLLGFAWLLYTRKIFIKV
ncbi:MAG: heparan-alpha-glucosaminide N-acetyltransferase domain-containing protein [Gammaproteobacteria bacterium]|nr:heparan-alpha-glucosaminide N-acetyltransferase domain-containing protein [Gammaproteobacteria bacterium]